jgi:hypothetical protein
VRTLKSLDGLVTVLLALGVFPPPDPSTDDTRVHFPALETTIMNPEIAGRPMTVCAVFDGRRLCDEELGNAWCRKQGFGGGWVDWTTRESESAVACNGAPRCTVVATITCKGVPIVDD